MFNMLKNVIYIFARAWRRALLAPRNRFFLLILMLVFNFVLIRHIFDKNTIFVQEEPQIVFPFSAGAADMSDLLSHVVRDTDVVDGNSKNQTSPRKREHRVIPIPDLCGGRRVELVLCVTVSRGNAEGRQTIRETWGSSGVAKNSSTVLAFFVGASTANESELIQVQLEDESRTHGDIIQGNFVDTYENLTLKSLSVMQWTQKYCNHSEYIAKVDDDNYINIPLLHSNLKNFSSVLGDEKFIFGLLYPDSKPVREKSSKWYMPVELYQNDTYPRYVSGTSYAMTSSAAVAIANVAHSVPFLWLEDIYITGMCAKQANITLIHTKEIRVWKADANPETFVHRIAGHPYTPLQIRHIHKALSSKEHITRNNCGKLSRTSWLLVSVLVTLLCRVLAS